MAMTGPATSISPSSSPPRGQRATLRKIWRSFFGGSSSTSSSRNRDDHLRNHGFLRTRSGWRLAPAYDMNPNREKHEHALALDEASAEPRLDTVLETAEFYRLTSTEAKKIISQVRTVVSGWREKAQSIGLSRAELQRMEPAFANDLE